MTDPRATRRSPGGAGRPAPPGLVVCGAVVALLAVGVVTFSRVASAGEPVDVPHRTLRVVGHDGWTQRMGWGVLLRPGEVLTLGHVLAGCRSAEVQSPSGRSSPVRGVVAEWDDLVLLRVPDLVDRSLVPALAGSPAVPGESAVVDARAIEGGRLQASTVVRGPRDADPPTVEFVVEFAAEPGFSGTPVYRAADGGLLGLVAGTGRGAGYTEVLTVRTIAAAPRETPRPLETVARWKDPWRLDYSAGCSALDHGRWATALEHFRRVIRAAGEAPEVAACWRGSVEAYERLGRLEDSVRTASAEVRRSPTSAASWYGYGLALDRSGRAPEALAALRRCVRSAPDSAVYALGLALALARSGDLAGAEATARDTVRRRPDDPEAYGTLALVLARSGKDPEAAAAYATALALDPAYVFARHGLGVVLIRLGRLREAVQALELAARGDPRSPDVAGALGEVRARLGDYAEAIPPLERQRAAKPWSMHANWWLGASYAALGRRDEAAAALVRVAARDPRWAEELRALIRARDEADRARR